MQIELWSLQFKWVDIAWYGFGMVTLLPIVLALMEWMSYTVLVRTYTTVHVLGWATLTKPGTHQYAQDLYGGAGAHHSGVRCHTQQSEGDGE